ncbi:MAG: type VI secretion system-associated protein TagF [Curvibacter sp.]|nr:type VI secretion system-associated protein TagF [Curvibacter sp.]
MPQQSVMRQPAPTCRPGWFGKLPSVGDFAGRRVPHVFNTEWDHWFRSGMELLRGQGDGLWVEDFARSPAWCFICPAGVTGWPVCGLLVPSRDRVGRAYPLTVLALAPTPAAPALLDPVLPRFFEGALAAVEAARQQGLGVEELDRLVSVLPSPFAGSRGPLAWLSGLMGGRSSPAPSPGDRLHAWRQILTRGSDRSLWWTCAPSQADGPMRPGRELTHQGPLNQILFLRLFQGQGD